MRISIGFLSALAAVWSGAAYAQSLPTLVVTPGSGQTINTLPNAGQTTKTGSIPVVPPSDWTMPAFTVIPAFKIDQTTPGTTNKVEAGSSGVVRAALGTAFAYTAGKCVGPVTTYAVFSRAGGSGILNRIHMIVETVSVIPTVKVLVWDKLPAVTCADQATYTDNGADAANLVGRFDITSVGGMSGIGIGGSDGSATITPFSTANKDTSPSANLYALVVANGSFTTTATGNIKIELDVANH